MGLLVYKVYKDYKVYKVFTLHISNSLLTTHYSGFLNLIPIFVQYFHCSEI